MNERIQDLANQAKQSVPHGILGVDKWIELYNEKFAELIIKETLMIARVGMEFGPSMDEAVYTYFGVEE